MVWYLYSHTTGSHHVMYVTCGVRGTVEVEKQSSDPGHEVD